MWREHLCIIHLYYASLSSFSSSALVFEGQVSIYIYFLFITEKNPPTNEVTKGKFERRKLLCLLQKLYVRYLCGRNRQKEDKTKGKYEV